MNSDDRLGLDNLLVRQLRATLARVESGKRRETIERISTGCEALDRRLPRGGFVRGSLVEWLSESPGCGAGLFVLRAAREAQRAGGVVVIVDRSRAFYPPAAAAQGLNLAEAIVIHPVRERDELWALDQALRCEHVAAVLGWPRRLDVRVCRRLQLAAEASGAVGLFVRPATARCEPSWTDVRLLVTPRPSPRGWRLSVRLLHCRGRFGQGEWDVALDVDERTGEIHEAHPSDLAAELAHSAARLRHI